MQSKKVEYAEDCGSLENQKLAIELMQLHRSVMNGTEPTISSQELIRKLREDDENAKAGHYTKRTA